MVYKIRNGHKNIPFRCITQKSPLYKEKRMVRKKFKTGMLIIMLVVGGVMTTGCASLFSSTPKSFSRGSAGDTSILLRQGLDANQAFREAIFILNRHGFEPEMLTPEAGYLRTRWNNRWNDKGTELEYYRVRVVLSFNPSRTQLIVSAPSEYYKGGRWITGYDTRAIETLRTDLTQIIGN